MSGLNPAPRPTVMTAAYLQQPEEQRNVKGGLGRTLLGGAAGAVIGGTIGYMGIAILEVMTAGMATPLILSVLSGGLIGGAFANRQHKAEHTRNRPLTITENGKETTVYVSASQWRRMQQNSINGYIYDRVPELQFVSAVPSPQTKP